MSRIIKFRAWDNLEKRMIKEVWEIGFGTREDTESWLVGDDTQIKNFELMQFTGLLDKNGKEIYENDYLQWGSEIMCVFWGSGKYILQNISSGDIIDCNEHTTSVREIIGNKYENPREHPAMASDL